MPPDYSEILSEINTRWQSLREESTWAKFHANRDYVEYYNNRALLDSTLPNFSEPIELVSEIIDVHRLTRGSSILDIGAGSGRIAIPLTQLGMVIDAVEPSDVMVGNMQRNWPEGTPPPRRTLIKKWEDVQVETNLKPPYDAIIFVHSFVMNDLINSLEKAIRASIGGSIVTHQMRELNDVALAWERVSGDSFQDGPGPDVICDALRALGEDPRTISTPRCASTICRNLTDAAAWIELQMGPASEGHRTEIREIAATIYQRSSDSLIFDFEFDEVHIYW